VGKIHGDMNGTHIIFVPDPTNMNPSIYPLGALSHVGHILIAIAIDIQVGVTIVEVAISAIPTIAAGAALAASPLSALINIIGESMLGFGAILLFYLPMLPMIRVAEAVLAWLCAVFEAVMLVPIAALSFLSTVGEGWNAERVFVNWLDVLTRPILTVIGFVASILLFNSFFSYSVYVFEHLIQIGLQKGTIMEFVGMFVHAGIFVTVMYTAANTCFKMMHVIPNAFFRWTPFGGSPSQADGGFGGDHAGFLNNVGRGVNAAAKAEGQAIGNAGGAALGAAGKGMGKLAGAIKGGTPEIEGG